MVLKQKGQPRSRFRPLPADHFSIRGHCSAIFGIGRADPGQDFLKKFLKGAGLDLEVLKGVKRKSFLQLELLKRVREGNPFFGMVGHKHRLNGQQFIPEVQEGFVLRTPFSFFLNPVF